MSKPKDFESRGEMRPVKSPAEWSERSGSRGAEPSQNARAEAQAQAVRLMAGDVSPNARARDAAVVLLKETLSGKWRTGDAVVSDNIRAALVCLEEIK